MQVNFLCGLSNIKPKLGLIFRMEARVETGILVFGEVNQIPISIYVRNWIQRLLFKN
jgi:hypothetical protein